MIELMITLFIVGVLLTMGLPSLKTFMQGNQLVAATNELISALHVARSEAIKINSRVSICESSNGKDCATTGDWKDGWIVFVDAADPSGDLNNTGLPCVAANEDCLLRIHDGFTDNQLAVNGIYDSNGNAISSFTFTSRGLPKAVNGSAQSGVFSVCSLDTSGTTLDSRAVVLSLSGRVRVSDNAAVITCP